jgi:subfamily B ATP-binding cassette protein MsbA
MKDLLNQYLPYLKEYKLYFVYAVLGMIAIAIGTTGTAHLIKPILDDIFINKDQEMLSILPFMFVAVFALKGFGKLLQTYYMAYIGQDIVRKLRDTIVLHLTHLDIDFFKKHHTGEIISRITNDIARIQDVVSNIIPNLFREIFTIIALTGYILYLNPKLALYFFIFIPLVIYPISKLAKRMRKYSKLSQESTADMTARLGEIFYNIEVIKSNSSQNFEHQRFSIQNYWVFKYIMKQIKTHALTSPVMEVIGAIAIGVVVYIGGMEVIRGNMSVGSFFAFATALFLLYDPIRRLSSLYNKAQDAIAANIRMHELLATTPQIQNGIIRLNEPITTIVFHDVALKYTQKSILKGVNIEINKGEYIALAGSSGAGKSSLVSLLVRFYDPSSGSLTINGHNIKDLDINSLHDTIGYVTQKVFIFNDTIAKNVAYNAHEIDENRVIQALQKANAWSFVQKLEEGIDTLLSEGGENLSGGQRQRIALARALYKNPQILILDEATSALDNQSEQLINKALLELKDDMIIISIAHRLSSIENADTIYVFKDGKILCKGSAQELASSCIEYQELNQDYKSE